MKTTLSCTEWKEIITNFNSYSGSIASFCKQYEINQHQLYYQRKKIESVSTTFISIPIKESNIMSPNNISDVEQDSTLINISIGKATLKMETINSDNLRLVLKTLLALC